MAATDPKRSVGNKDAKLQNLSFASENRTFQSTLATAEIWLGTVLVVACALFQAARLLGLQFELSGVLVLLPFLILVAAVLLAVAGASMRRFPQYPILSHFPLLLWLVVFCLAFV